MVDSVKSLMILAGVGVLLLFLSSLLIGSRLSS
jgi:hypothetical protein